MPTAARQTSSYLLETRRALILLDAGTGVARLSDPLFQLLISRHSRALVILTSYEHDRVAGLPLLPFYFSGLETALLGPPARSGGGHPMEVLGRWLAPPFFGPPFSAWGSLFPQGFSVHEAKSGRTTVLGERVESVGDLEPGRAWALRIRDVGYVGSVVTGDRGPLEDVALLLHDAYLDDEALASDPAAAERRGSVRQAAETARDVRARDLLLANTHPAADQPRLDRLLLTAGAIFAKAILAADMMATEIRGSKDESETPDAGAPEAGAAESGEQGGDGAEA